MLTNGRVDPSEIEKFNALADEWWDFSGKFKPLHLMNPCRLDYINSQVAIQFERSLRKSMPFEGVRLVDIGCGGGLLTEPMARLGADVTGVDAAANNIPAAQTHAERSGLSIDYRHATAEDLVRERERFDVVLSMEVVEHVPNPGAFILSCGELLNPGGVMICSTINRNAKSFALAIVGAEWVLRWVPIGTHDWNRFITPEELSGHLEAAGLEPVDSKGFAYNPISRDWSISDHDLSVNYAATAVKPNPE